MPRIGLEPTHLAAPDPKSGVSTNSTIWARCSSLPCLAIYANTSVFSHTIEMQMEVLILVVLSTLKEMRRKKPAAFIREGLVQAVKKTQKLSTNTCTYTYKIEFLHKCVAENSVLVYGLYFSAH